MNEIPSRYNPKETEDKWYKFWEENNLFAAKVNPAKKPFCIVIPPPNVTGILHMGHALNNTIQDILIRYHRMKGEESLWMPGTDHAGIATQNVVEKAIAKDGLTRQALGREKFIERVWLWKEQYGSTIIRQLKKLGASCDWQRLRFTMDEEYSRAVKEVFVRLWNEGLIYQDDKVINWCPRCQTALSDEEAPHREIQGNLYYIRYPLKSVSQLASEPVSRFKQTNRQTDKQTNYIVVATTRPETMLGDTAVAVNPKDKRYKRFVGKSLILPLVNREIRIIADSMVDMKFSTGAVKVTPAHDPNDYILGKKYNLEFVNVMYPDGRMNENASNYSGLDRFKAREVILEDLKEKGLLEKIEPHTLSAGHCYRCHTIIEPYLSRQWFVKMRPLSKPALEAVKKGMIKFYPKRWTKVYINWMENIQDWCISRQIWWGHRLPIYYCKKCQAGKSEILNPKSETNPKSKIQNPKYLEVKKGIIVSRAKPEKCSDCGSAEIYQEEDVLDTWFSSWLWPFATFDWPFVSGSVSQLASGPVSGLKTLTGEPANRLTGELNYFYPTSVLVTAPEIIFFWVARMIMAGMEFTKDIPFKDVYIHGTVRDIEGKKMSKSLGNIIDPQDVIDEYGADALRFSLISITSQGQDVHLSKEKFEQGRNFANKIWNASRFILMNLDASLVRVNLCEFFKKDDLDIVNRWILSRFYSMLKEVNKALDNYRFNEAANTLYGFFWHEFCDWYLELIKPDVKNKQNQVVMYKVLEKSLRILHPFMPFITEEVWQRLHEQGLSPKGTVPAESSIMVQSIPHIQPQMVDKKLEKEAKLIFDTITQIRNLRSSIEIKQDLKLKVSVYPHTKVRLRLIKEQAGLISNLAKLEALELLDTNKRPKGTLSSIIEDIDIYLHFSGLLDTALEQIKIKQKLDNLRQNLKSKESRAKNAEFIKNAPKEIVDKEKESIAKLKNELKRLEKMSDELH